MKFRWFSALALASACVCVAAAKAQSTPIESGSPGAQPSTGEVPETAQPAMPSCCNIPALAVVELEITAEASSKTSQVGQKVPIRLTEPLTVDGKVVVPAGTSGFAEVIQASKARMMGKAGELVLGLSYLELRGQRIPLKRFRYGASTGRGNDVAALVATSAIGLPGLLISGGNVQITPGTRANAVVTSDTFVAPQP